MSSRPQIEVIHLQGHDILKGEDSWLVNLQKVASIPTDAHSKQGAVKGTLPHLIDYRAALNLKNFNVHHSTCVEARIDAIVGLGHKIPKIDQVLDPYCRVSWQDVLNNVVQDYVELGNGYIEIVRNKVGQIRGIYHLPAVHVWIHLEENANVFHFEINNNSELVAESTLRFARFGDLDLFKRRRKGLVGSSRAGRPINSSETISEVIHFPRSSNRSRHYGYIDWAAAVPSMELEQCVTQYQYDFFLNGGVMDGIYTVSGKEMDKDDWEKIKAEFREHAGLGNRRKVMLLNLGDPDLTAQFDRLAMDGQSEGNFKDFQDTLALKIVSAHRVPPLIAGITVPGKLGAANEMTNAMLLFQSLAISPDQKRISKILARTLGDPENNGDLDLTADDFLGIGAGDPELDPTRPPSATGEPAMRPKNNKGNGFNTITEEIDIGEADTIARMRTSMSEARFRGRDLSQGVAERGNEISKQEVSIAKILPSPNAEESREDFIARFMASEEARREFPNKDQRLAVANRIWENK